MFSANITDHALKYGPLIVCIAVAIYSQLVGRAAYRGRLPWNTAIRHSTIAGTLMGVLSVGMLWLSWTTFPGDTRAMPAEALGASAVLIAFCGLAGWAVMKRAEVWAKNRKSDASKVTIHDDESDTPHD